jgi:hypothetical protein
MFGENDVEEHSPAVSAHLSTLKKRGRPSLSGSATPAKSVASRTPRSTKSAATPKSVSRSVGRRKAAEPEPEQEELEEEEGEEQGEEEEEEEGEEDIENTPAPKRGRPARSAGTSASARLAAKAAKKPARGRPKATTVSSAPDTRVYSSNAAIQTATKPAKKVGRPRKNATNGEVAADEYEVETIVESAIDADTMAHMYLVKWKNYPASENTWEPKKNLEGSLDLVRKFDTQKKKAEAAEAAKKAAAKKTAAAASGPAKRATRGPKPKAVKAVKKAPGRPPGRKRRARA